MFLDPTSPKRSPKMKRSILFFKTQQGSDRSHSTSNIGVERELICRMLLNHYKTMLFTKCYVMLYYKVIVGNYGIRWEGDITTIDLSFVHIFR